MPINYIYNKYKDVHTIENTGLTSLQYRINIVECGSTTLYKEGVIQPDVTFILPILFSDAIYSITLTNDLDETETLPDILQYSNLLCSFIEGVEETLCGCKKCNDCEECNECQNYLNTLTYGLGFLHVNTPTYNDYLTTISETLRCNYSQEILCMISNESVNGVIETKKLTLLNIALLYLTYYQFDLVQAFDLEEADYIKNKYKSSKILKCIQKLGINVDDFNEELFTDMQVYYWQLDNPIDDITNVIPLINSTYLNDKPVLPFESFEDGENVSYSLIGRAVFAIKETDILNFLIFDSLNNDVTDEFDIDYNATFKTILFVSKVHYSFSTMYFKFKKNLFNE